MRLDKYLKVSRLIKRRTLAKEASDADRVLVNGKAAKPSKEVQVGDIITIIFGKKIVDVKISDVSSTEFRKTLNKDIVTKDVFEYIIKNEIY